MKKIMFNDKYSLTDAVLNQQKTMTRRLIKTKTQYDFLGFDLDTGEACFGLNDQILEKVKPRYETGDVVAIAQKYKDMYTPPLIDENGNHYVIGNATAGWNNKMFVAADNCIHQIKITGVTVERLQDISDEDCEKEGSTLLSAPILTLLLKSTSFLSPPEIFASLIDKTYKSGTWDKNPWVFVYKFKLVK